MIATLLSRALITIAFCAVPTLPSQHATQTCRGSRFLRPCQVCSWRSRACSTIALSAAAASDVNAIFFLTDVSSLLFDILLVDTLCRYRAAFALCVNKSRRRARHLPVSCRCCCFTIFFKRQCICDSSRNTRQTIAGASSPLSVHNRDRQDVNVKQQRQPYDFSTGGFARRCKSKHAVCGWRRRWS